MCKEGTVAYHLVLENITGREILEKSECCTESYPEFSKALKETTFTKIETDMVEEHYRYGIQNGNTISVEGLHKGKSFALEVSYEPESTTITGDFTEDEKEDINLFAWGESMYYFLRGLDIIYREQHPETPKLFFCTER